MAEITTFGFPHLGEWVGWLTKIFEKVQNGLKVMVKIQKKNGFKFFFSKPFMYHISTKSAWITVPDQEMGQSSTIHSLTPEGLQILRYYLAGHLGRHLKQLLMQFLEFTVMYS